MTTKCAFPKCEEPAIYVWIDACPLDGNVIHPNEMNVYPVCFEHDDFGHVKVFGGLEPNRRLAKTLRISKARKCRQPRS